MVCALTLHVQESCTRTDAWHSDSSRPRVLHKTIPWRIWQVLSASTRSCMEQRCWGDSCVRSPAEVVGGKTSVTGASRVTRQRLFLHCENSRGRVSQCSSDSNCGGSSAQLHVYVVHVLPCVLCALRVGTPCFCSEPHVNISTAEFSWGDFIFACNVLTIATLLPEHTKQLPT